MHGFGKFIFADGKMYEGYYKNDKKHGFGVFTWSGSPTQRRYEGWWTEGKQDGYGVIIEQVLEKDAQKKNKLTFVSYKDG